MHVRLLTAFAESDGDTAVDPRPTASRRLRRVWSAPRAEDDQPEPLPPEPCLGVRGDPGATLAKSRLAQVRVREAIVRRNHLIDRAERAPRRASSAPKMTLVRVDWVRADDAGLRAQRSGADGLRLSGFVEGAPVRAGRAPSAPRAARPASLAVGVDGLIFTTALTTGDDAAAAARALAQRLGHHFDVAVELEGDDVVLRLLRPRALRG